MVGNAEVFHRMADDAVKLVPVTVMARLGALTMPEGGVTAETVGARGASMVNAAGEELWAPLATVICAAPTASRSLAATEKVSWLPLITAVERAELFQKTLLAALKLAPATIIV